MKKTDILIIDDDADDLHFLLNAIEETGLQNQCVGFSSPVKALEYLKTNNNHPALIVSDINMPFINGYEFKENVDKVIALKNIPFLFISTSCKDVDALRLTGADCITKPADSKGYREIAKHISKLVA